MDSKILSDLGSSAAHDSKGGSSSGRGSSTRRTLCLFRVAKDYFALDVAYVGEILTVNRVTKVPMTPPEIIGLYNLRGVALALVELGTLLGLEDEGLGDISGTKELTVLVLKYEDGLSAGVPIRHVDSILTCDSSQIRPSEASNESPIVEGILELSGTRQGQRASLINGSALHTKLEGLRFVSRKDSAA